MTAPPQLNLDKIKGPFADLGIAAKVFGEVFGSIPDEERSLWRYLTRRHKRRRPRRSRGAILYLLFIICANPKPAVRNLAMKLARHAVQLSRASKR